MYQTFLFLAAIAALLAVAMGAFGAHALRTALTADMMAVYHTAVNYHMWHALGLGLVALLSLHYPQSLLLRWAGWLMCVGIVLFSGSLYALSISGIKWLGAITPFGGSAFLIAWLLLALFALRLP
jgi:uncharacterized membrane protein YgdD (TMEM256/DUF423 family)